LEGKLEIAKSLKENGIPTELIQKTIGLSKEEIERL
jgi:predicted transposase YdaD